MTGSIAFEAIGTKWQIDYTPPHAATKPTELRTTIDQTIEKFDQSFSRFRSDSWVTHVRSNPGTHELPPDALELLQLYEAAYRTTDGKVTPLIGTALEQAGYDAGYSLKSRPIDPVPAFTDVVTFTSKSITTTMPVLLDFGAAGKGYLIDRVAELLANTGIKEFVINAGGDIVRSTNTRQPITIGLENPFDTTQAIGTCELIRGSICASAGSRRAWENYTHILDPFSLSSPKEVAATWVKADSAAIADLVATALFFVPAARLRDSFVFDYAVLDADMSLQASGGFGLHAFTGEPA